MMMIFSKICLFSNWLAAAVAHSESLLSVALA